MEEICVFFLKKKQPRGLSSNLGTNSSYCDQGCGKTTIVAELVELFSACDVGATFFSVDDFYLTFAEQNRVAEANPGNPLLKMRGNAGSHDLQLGSETISAFRKLTQKEMSAKAPRFVDTLLT